ncbi:hypothetical protein Bbelb_075140 [Branchiostoma belcheri]|nr:hypothetical protein Bbelb_075140 [Branchiostoma belcheri]
MGPLRVAIIGAGVSGLTSIKACLEEGLQPVCFEQHDDLGGVWYYSDEVRPNQGSAVYRSLITNTSKEMMSFSDFPFPKDTPPYLPYHRVYTYLQDYARHFDLRKHIRFNTQVSRIQKTEDFDETGRWEVRTVQTGHGDGEQKEIFDAVMEPARDLTAARPNCKSRSAPYHTPHGSRRATDRAPDGSLTENGRKIRRTLGVMTPAGVYAEDMPNGRRFKCDLSIKCTFTMICCFHTVQPTVCNGVFARPYVPDVPGLSDFAGVTMHSQEYRTAQQFTGKKVIVVGAGNSAGDVAAHIAQVASQVYLSLRDGAWVLPRLAQAGMPRDMLLRRVLMNMPEFIVNKIIRREANARVCHDNYGLTCPAEPLNHLIMVNDEIGYRLTTGQVIAKPQLSRLTQHAARFADGSTVDGLDAVVFATGFNLAFTFIDESILPSKKEDLNLYKMVFPAEHTKPTLSVIGCLSSNGPHPPIDELQARWAVRVFLFQNKPLGDPNSCHFFPTPRAIYQPKFVTLVCPDHEISKPEVMLQYLGKPPGGPKSNHF